jgi:23S rRNA pseudouridine1911/1915/1917 synthase
LALFHPVTGEWMTWQAPLPSDFTELLTELAKDNELHPSFG